jgi:hypothetical protein
MWFRFVWISLLNWTTNLVIVMVLLRFILPDSLHGFVLAIIPWAISFVLAFAFAELAFRPKLPGKNEAAMLVILWLVIGYSLHILYATFILNNALVVLRAADLHITYAFEVAGILCAAYVTRRRKIKEVLGEGLSE